MNRLKYFAIGALVVMTMGAALGTPGASIDETLQDHEDRITALENVPTTTQPPTTTPPTTTTTPSGTTTTTTTTTPAPSTTTTILPATVATLPANGQVSCDDCALDGAGLTYPVINLNGRRNVSVRNAVVTGDPGGPLQSGTVNIRGASGIVVENVQVFDSPRSCFSLEGSTGVTILNSQCWNPEHLGFHGGDVKDVLISGNLVSGSSQRNTDIGWESGGLKLLRGSNINVINNIFKDGFGPGIWFDGDINGGLIANNQIMNQSAEGIFVEISRHVVVLRNDVRNSPTGKNSSRMGWLYGGGILIATSYDITVESNVVVGSYHGITVIDQCRRGDAPPGHDASLYFVTGNTVRDVNKVGAAEDCSNPAVFHGRWENNSFSNVQQFVWGVTPSPF